MVVFFFVVLGYFVTACAEPSDSAADTSSRARDTVRAPAIDSSQVRNVVTDTALKEPQLVLHGSEYRLHLPAPIAAALLREGFIEIARAEDYNVDLRRFASDIGPRQALFAVIGDFDNDGRDDVVAHVRKRIAGDSAQVIVAILNQSTGPRVIEIERYPLYAGLLGEYLTYQKAETVRSAHEKQPLTLTADAFQVVFFEKAAHLYYYRDGRFRKYQTAD